MTDQTETCDDCGFDAAEWNRLDTQRTIGAAGTLFELWTSGMTSTMLNRRPAASVWSPLEYADHTRETLFGLRVLAEVALATPDTDLGPAIEPSDPGEPRSFDRDLVFSALSEEASVFAGRLAEISETQWDQSVRLGGHSRSVGWAARHAVHDLWHHLIDVADGRSATGDPTPPGQGTVAQINTSEGGVPKLPVTEARVGRRGLDGDQQAARVHHGRPWQALCLWSTDVIDDLRDAGHPIEPGSAGENVSLTGLDWAVMRAGTVLEIGDVRCQLSAPAIPCAKNARWFEDGDFNRILHTRHPERTRWYASVLTPGTVRPGDPVRVVR